MVGLIQKILVDMIRDLANEETLAEIKKIANVPLDKEFQINTFYSDEEWQSLLKATLKVLNISNDQADETYAKYFLKDALERFPTWFQMSKNSYEFLNIQATIHNCFATGVVDQKHPGVVDQKHRDAINDKFKVEKLPGKIITHYKSLNHHCGLYKKLAQEVINHYKDEAIIEEKKCMQNGHDECEIHVQWSNLAA